MYTVWYCTVGSAILYCTEGLCKLSLEEARAITLEDFDQNHWFIETYPNGWLEIRDEEFFLVSSSRKVMKQLGLFGEGV